MAKEQQELDLDIDEDKLSKLKDEPDNIQEDDVPDISPEMQKALDNGWRPEDEWDGDPDTWVDYKTFNLKGDLIGQVTAQRRRAEAIERSQKETQQKLQQMIELNKRLLKSDVEKAKKELKSEKRQAMEEGDYDRVDEIEDRIKTVEKDYEEAIAEEESRSTQAENESNEQVDSDNVSHPAMLSWLQTHEKTLNSNPDFVEDAKVFASQYKALHSDDYDPEAAVKYVDNKLKKLHPEAYSTQRRRSHVTEPVGDTTPRRINGRKYSLKDCNESERAIAKEMAEDAGMTPDEYVNLLAKDGVLECQQR